ncbi:MAG: phosphatidate cytidylyltransferase [Ginsengibacter sp.]
MALDTQTFKTRTGTAVIFAAVMLTGLLWNKWSFLILFTIIHFGCWYEFIKLLKKIDQRNYLLKALLGLLYITLPIVLLMVMRLNNYTGLTDNYLKVLPCGIIFSIWINDTMAYLVGSFIGKNPLSKISPKKTWEGTIGGMILCVLVITIIGRATGFFNWQDWFVISLVCAIAGTLGDLLESKIKRIAQVKDSGSLMPGHGGFLDRFDSFLVATPFVFLYYFLFIVA